MVDSMMIIGSEEWCELPQLGIPAIKARIDSGAKTSAIHAYKMKPFKKGSELWLKYELHPLQNNRSTIIKCESQVIDKRRIKNTSGVSESRYVIKTPIRMNEQTWDIELTLTNRDAMGYRMLLGREAMLERILVNPSAHFLLGDRTDTDIKATYGSVNKHSNNLKLGLLATNPNLYSNQRIMEAGEQRGHDITFFNIRDCYMKLDAESPEVAYHGGMILNDLDAVIPRIRPSLTFYGCALTRQFESIGVYALNSANAITQSRDKLFSLQMLLKNGLEIPTSGFASSSAETNSLIDMVGGAPLIIKLLSGTQGKGVVLADTKKASESVIDAFQTLKANMLVQEFIKEAGGKDLRLFVVNGKVVGAMQRSAAAGEFRANVHQGGNIKKISITPQERKIAVQAAKIFDLKVAGVDIIRSSKGPLILEVNSSPGLQGIEAVTEKDIAQTMIKAIEQKLGWKA
ncbi:MAG: 30S ribosomal protein S6--L-glutamate ligase [Arenicella sp.]